MKLVIAIIRPHVVDDVRDALLALGINALTSTEVKGYGRQKGHKEMYRGAEYSIDFVRRRKWKWLWTTTRATPSSRRLPLPPAADRSVTGNCSSWTSGRRFGSGPERQARARSEGCQA